MQPTLSVVVAARASERDPGECLAALQPQVGSDVEVLVVHDRPPPDPGPAWAHTLVRPGALVPQLWAEGLRRARGELVALTSSTITPDGDWVARIRAVHRDDLVGAGGPIEPADGLGLVQWAVYFCRYTPYMLPLLPDGEVEVAADNASYRLATLRRYERLYADGFWEPFVHAALRADGHQVRVVPGPVVRHAGGTAALAFARQRFRHGRAHGLQRSAGGGPLTVVVAAASAPLVPAVMTLRAARAVTRKRRHRARFALAAPLVFAFYACWAGGELVGRVLAAPGR